MAFTPMLFVEDVEASSRWLRSVLLLESMHGGPDFEMLADGQGQVILWLHTLRAQHDHAQQEGMVAGALTGGCVLHLKVEDLQPIYQRALSMQARILDPPHDNPLARWREFSFQAPSGYRFALHTGFGSL